MGPGILPRRRRCRCRASPPSLHCVQEGENDEGEVAPAQVDMDILERQWTETVEDESRPWVVTYTTHLGESVVVDYTEWRKMIHDGGDAYWWNDATAESLWERPGECGCGCGVARVLLSERCVGRCGKGVGCDNCAAPLGCPLSHSSVYRIVLDRLE